MITDAEDARTCLPLNIQKRLVPGARVRVKVGQGYMRRESLATREWEGVIQTVVRWKVEHAREGKIDHARIGQVRSILVAGTPSTRASDYCHRCGKLIEHFISRQVGYGPVCSDYLGIPRPEQLTLDEIAAIRARIDQEYARELWISTDYSAVEILEDSPPPTTTEPERPPWDAKFLIENNAIVVKTFPEFRHRAKAVSGWRYDDQTHTWQYPISPSIALQLKAAFDGVKRLASPAFIQLLRDADTQGEKQAIKEATDLAPLPGMQTEGWLHQRRAFWFVKDCKPGAALFMDMGCGKSLVALAVIYARGIDRTLILAPKNVVSRDHTWSKNVGIHCPGAITVIEAQDKSGWTFMDRIEDIERRMRAVRYPLVVVLNYEALDNAEVVKWIIHQNFGLMITDESHKLKAPSGVRARQAWKLSMQIPQRLALTGTPIPHSPLDIFSQFKILDPGIFGTSVVKFKQRYAREGGYQGREIVGWTHQDEMHKLIYSIGYRVGAEVLDLPPERHEQVYVTLSPSALKTYDAMEDEMIAKVGEGEITAANALVKLLRLAQVTSGFLPDEDGTVHTIDTGKEDALANILDALQPPTVDERGERVPGEPVVVFCRFRHDLDVVQKVCQRTSASTGHSPFKYAELSGRKAELAEWTAGERDVIGVQIQAGGAGIDLTRARYAVYFSVGYSLGDYLQSVKRVHRPGQTRATTYYHLIARQTVDETIYHALDTRQEVVDSILLRFKEESTHVDYAATRMGESRTPDA